MLDANPSLTPDAVRTIFEHTALDIETVGVYCDSGVGIVTANTALAAGAAKFSRTNNRGTRPPGARLSAGLDGKIAALCEAVK